MGHKQKYSFTLPVTGMDQEKVKEFSEMFKKDTEKQKEEIHQEFRDSFEEFYELNKEPLANDKYPEGLKAWVKKIASEIWFFACLHGWNKCYEFHEKIINDGLEYGTDR